MLVHASGEELEAVAAREQKQRWLEERRREWEATHAARRRLANEDDTEKSRSLYQNCM